MPSCYLFLTCIFLAGGGWSKPASNSLNLSVVSMKFFSPRYPLIIIVLRFLFISQCGQTVLE